MGAGEDTTPHAGGGSKEFRGHAGRNQIAGGHDRFTRPHAQAKTQARLKAVRLPLASTSYFFRILSTALASSRNSSCAAEFGAYSATVSPLNAASATTIRCPMGGSTFFPIFFSEDSRPRPRLVDISTLEGTNRIRGFLERRSARALSVIDRASFSANRSSGAPRNRVSGSCLPRCSCLRISGAGWRPRLARLERLNRLSTGPQRLRIQCGYLKKLPDDYAGPRHVVTVRQLPPGPGAYSGEDWFEWEERPGPEPASNATSPNDVLLVRVCYVEAKRKA